MAEVFAVLTALLWVKHKANINRLLNGTESRIGSKNKSETDRDSEPATDGPDA